MTDLIADVLTIFTIFVITFVAARYYWNCYVSPPGPWGLPYLGLLPQIFWHEFSNYLRGQPTSIMLYRHQLGEYYATRGGQGVWSSCMGEQRVTFLHSYDAIKEALVHNSSTFSNRPEADAYQKAAQGKGVILSNGPLWSMHRKFSLSVLRTLGMGKSVLEKQIVSEACRLNEFIRERTLEDSDGHGLNTQSIIVRGTLNIICQLVFGRRFEYRDHKLDQLQETIQNVTQIKGLLPMTEFFYPSLSKWGILHLFGGSTDAATQNYKLLQVEVSRLVEEIQSNYDPSETPTNYVQAFLQKQHSGEHVETFTMDQLIAATVDLFIAGTDTTTNAIGWILLFLALHPHYQLQMQHEIDMLLGELRIDDQMDRMQQVTSMSMRSQLPWTCAVIDEALRHGSIVPFSVDRAVQRDCLFRGFKFQRGDVIMTNLYAVHHDAKYWEDPMNFAPEKHFMDAETRSVYQPSKFLNAFGMGARQCLGENIAKSEIFLFVSNIVREFDLEVKLERGSSLEAVLMGRDGITRSPGDHRIIFKSRRDSRK